MAGRNPPLGRESLRQSSWADCAELKICQLSTFFESRDFYFLTAGCCEGGKSWQNGFSRSLPKLKIQTWGRTSTNWRANFWPHYISTPLINRILFSRENCPQAFIFVSFKYQNIEGKHRSQAFLGLEARKKRVNAWTFNDVVCDFRDFRDIRKSISSFSKVKVSPFPYYLI